MGITQASAPKQPSEKLRIGVDFTAALAVGDSVLLAGSSVVAYDSAGNDVSATLIDTGSLQLLSNVLSALVVNGTDGEEYKLTFRAATSNGELLEEDYVLPVEEL